MKVDWKTKQTSVVEILLAVIIFPIAFRQAKSLITGAISSYMMSQPKTLEVMNRESKDINPTYSTTRRVESQKSVDIIARVKGWIQERYFQEGDRVTKGQRLFLIEPDKYILVQNRQEQLYTKIQQYIKIPKSI